MYRFVYITCQRNEPVKLEGNFGGENGADNPVCSLL
jgi:hypothetical protein